MVNDAGKNFSIQKESGYALALVEDFQLLDLEELKSVDALVIISHTVAMTSHVVRRIRTSREMVLYLLPIFIIGNAESLPVSIAQVIDGSVASSSELHRLTDEISRIKQNTQNLW